MMNTISGILLLAAAAAAVAQIIRIIRSHTAASDAPAWVLYTAAAVFLAAGIALPHVSGAPLTLDSDFLFNTTTAHRQETTGSGVTHTGWLERDGDWYYYHPDGTLATGRTEVDGEVYFFTSAGVRFLLVNPWNPAPEGFIPDLVPMDDQYGTAGLEIDSSCYDALKEMIDACNAESGSRAYVLSTYRDLEMQQQLFDRKVGELMGQGYSREDAETEAATVVAVPGTSEHHLGLAVDIIDTRRWKLDEGQEDTKAQQWLMENSWRYGFIFRYPKDKTAITGIIYEPWHYRYVGTDLAAELHDLGLTLEEYIDSLS